MVGVEITDPWAQMLIGKFAAGEEYLGWKRRVDGPVFIVMIFGKDVRMMFMLR
jgi:hypothetical protein